MGSVSIGVEVQRNTDGDTPSTVEGQIQLSVKRQICDGAESDINRYANYKLGSLWYE